MAAQRQAGGGVIQRDGLALGGFEEIGLLLSALDDRRLGQQRARVDALLAGRRPQLPAAVPRCLAGSVSRARDTETSRVGVAGFGAGLDTPITTVPLLTIGHADLPPPK